jgi:hypothetical protein
VSGQDRDEAGQLLDPEVEQQLAEALRAAWSVSELDPRLNEQLIAAALDDPLALPTEEEVAESERLREALEGRTRHPNADLAVALRAASVPDELSRVAREKLEHEALPRPSRSNVIYVAFAGATAVATLAAAAALLLGPLRPAPTTAQTAGPKPSLVLSRSAAPLFKSKFETAATSARIDRIALARARDLRENRFSAWGIR